nr:type II secretion system F family protein [Microbacterium agarici]
MMIALPIFLIAACLAAVVGSLAPAESRSRRAIRANLAAGFDGDSADVDERAEPSVLGQLARRLVLPANRVKLEKLVALAGHPSAWPLERILVAKPLLAATALTLGLLLLGGSPGGLVVLLVIAVVITSYFVPDLLLHSRGIERQAAIELALPDTLDQMLIAVEAGLGFEAAMSRAGQNGSGPLAEELVRTLQDMRVGLSRREAYQAMVERTNVPDLRAFVRAVVQADAYGISITSVLRTQAKEMRVKRRQRAEEKAMKIPVKVLFPLMLFILPVLFIAVLGPTVINVVNG